MVLMVVDDLLFSSKIRAAAAAANAKVVTARTRAAVIEMLGTGENEAPSLVMVDLDTRPDQAIEIIRDVRSRCGAAPRIVGFGAHVNTERLQAARDAGCDQAVPRSAFVTMLPDLLSSPAAESR